MFAEKNTRCVLIRICTTDILSACVYLCIYIFAHKKKDKRTSYAYMKMCDERERIVRDEKKNYLIYDYIYRILYVVEKSADVCNNSKKRGKNKSFFFFYTQ